jgi:hypothetical protein
VPDVSPSFPETNHMLRATLAVAEEEFRSHVAACPDCSISFVLSHCDAGWQMLFRRANVRSVCLAAPQEANASRCQNY